MQYLSCSNGPAASIREALCDPGEYRVDGPTREASDWCKTSEGRGEYASSFHVVQQWLSGLDHIWVYLDLSQRSQSTSLLTSVRRFTWFTAGGTVAPSRIFSIWLSWKFERPMLLVSPAALHASISLHLPISLIYPDCGLNVATIYARSPAQPDSISSRCCDCFMCALTCCSNI